ncbi:MAG: pepsin/retropepsin-like aspartic protease family protein [Bacteroidota bacterium]
MNKLSSTLFLFLFSLSALCQIDPRIVKMTAEKDFFQLQEKLDHLKLDQKSRDYALALSHNAFGEYAQSIAIITNWKSNYSVDPADSVYKELLSTNIDNYYKLGRFREAAAATQEVIVGFPSITDEEELQDLRNTGQIWKGLENTAVQQVIFSKTTVIPFTRDIAKLINIEVKHTGGSTASVFDTGANISVATESTAQAMKLQTVADSIKVKAITGNEVYAKIAVCRELSIGDVTVNNAYFLVFPDADLTFGGGVYKINLIVGFPIIRDLGEIAVDQVGNTMTIVKDPKKHAHKNMYVDGLTPIIEVKIKDQPLQFSFDSGADKTMFYERFYALAKDNRSYELTAGKSTLGGAGGSKTIDIMIAKHLELTVGGETVKLSNSDVLLSNLMDEKEHLYGNLGQDVLLSRKKYVLNLKDMYFELSNR